MSRFTETPLQLQPLSEWNRVNKRPVDRKVERSWVLTDCIQYEVGAVGTGIVVHVPEGFVTDLASIPRPLWLWTPPFGTHALAAVLHDFLYTTHTVKTPVGRRKIERSEADDIFLEAMYVLGVRRSRALTMWAGVRVGGMFAWQSAYDRRLSRFKRS